MTHIVTIGNATLIHGNAYEEIDRLGSFDILCTDPPYKFDNRGGGTFRKTRKGADQIVAEGLDQGFDHRIIDPMLYRSVFVFCHNDQLAALLPYLAGLYQRYALLFWAKPSPSPMANKHYLADVEPYIHAWQEGYHPIGAHHDKHRFLITNPVANRIYEHATVKPAALMDKIMRNANGDTVLDPFMGTGSTGVAALRAGKRFTGIEKNEKHFLTACKRIRAAGVVGAA